MHTHAHAFQPVPSRTVFVCRRVSDIGKDISLEGAIENLAKQKKAVADAKKRKIQQRDGHIVMRCGQDVELSHVESLDAKNNTPWWTVFGYFELHERWEWLHFLSVTWKVKAFGWVNDGEQTLFSFMKRLLVLRS